MIFKKRGKYYLCIEGEYNRANESTRYYMINLKSLKRDSWFFVSDLRVGTEQYFGDFIAAAKEMGFKYVDARLEVILIEKVKK